MGFNWIVVHRRVELELPGSLIASLEILRLNVLFLASCVFASPIDMEERSFMLDSWSTAHLCPPYLWRWRTQSDGAR